MKNKCSALGAIAVFIFGVVWLVSCGTSDTPPETDRQSPPTQTPIPLTISPESQTDLAKTRAFFGKVTSLPIEVNAASKTPTPVAVTRTPAHTSVPTRAVAAPALIRHAVRQGDTLLGLAKLYGVSMATIQLANGMSDSIGLIAGQTLSIPSTSQWLHENSFWVVHIVRRGETLVGLSSTYGLTVDDILRVNAIADPALIRIDQQLVMPVAQLVTINRSPATATPARVAAAPAAAPAQETASHGSTGAAPDAVSAAQVPPIVPVPAPPGGPDDWPAYILARINKVRADHGLNTLTLVAELSHAAQAHAEDCVQRGWGSHVGSDGAVLKTRLERAGYFSRNSGENWVQARNAVRAFDWWYGEIPPNDPHRRNILGSRYTEIGIGIAHTGSSYVFITDFGSR